MVWEKIREIMVSRRFPSLNTTSCCQSRAVKYKTPNKISGNRYLHKMNHLLFNNLPNTMNSVKVTIAALNKKSLKDVALLMFFMTDLIFLEKRINIYSGIWWSLMQQDLSYLKNLQLGVKGNIQKSFVKFAFVAKLWNLSH